MGKSLTMKLKAGALIGAVALSAFVGRGQASADLTTSFTTSITCQNVGAATANVQLDIYSNTGASVATLNRTLPAGGADSIFVGSLGTLSSGFNGAGVLSADQQIVATLVQLPDVASAVKNRPLSNGFSDGSNTVLIATVLKATFNTTTKFSVQNIDSASANIAIKFYNTSNVLVTTINAPNVAANSAYYVNAGDVAALGANFNGSVIAESTRVGGGAGKIVATALELEVVGVRATAFEGVQSGSSTVYMATALCNAFGGSSTNYAVQNAGAAAVDVTVTYQGGGSETKPAVGPGAKVSISTCAVKPAGYSGAATITTSAGGSIVVVGKAAGPGVLATAFVGAPSGAAQLAHPYVRWSASRYDLGGRDRQRGNLAIQNVGLSAAANVVVKYIDKDGVVVGTHTIASIAPGAKANSNPILATLSPGYAGGTSLTEFGYYAGSVTGGGAIIDAPGSLLISVVRISSSPASGTVSEDYTGQPIQ